MVDYVRLAQTAARLVAANGRLVTFIELDNGVADPTRPWDGAADPRATPERTVQLSGVAVPPSSANALGLSTTADDLVKRSEQIFIVAQGQEDLRVFDEIEDGGTRWKITFTEILRPADVNVLGFVGVAR